MIVVKVELWPRGDPTRAGAGWRCSPRATPADDRGGAQGGPAQVGNGIPRCKRGSRARRVAGSVFVVSRDLVLVGAVSMALAGCASMPGPVLGRPGPALGRFGASGGQVGAWSAEAVRCVGSATTGPRPMTNVVFAETRRHSFLGGWVGTGIVSDSRSGPSTFVSAHRPGTDLPAKLRQEACARFEVAHHVQPDGTIGADVELDCDTGDGRRFVASLHAATCDRPPPTEGKL